MKKLIGTGSHRFDAFPRRCFDVVLAAAGLLVLSPLMLLIAVAIVAESGFPVFYAQTRLGLMKRHFRMYKFRKFHEDRGGQEFPLTLINDGRMTRVGRVLAATKLDELPQFFNILRGDMSVVGPRPESLAFADCYTEEHRPLFYHKPGIFGPSQVAFRSEASLYPSGQDPVKFYRTVIFPRKVHLDLAYYPRRTLIQDLNWVFLGVLAVLGAAVAQTGSRRDPDGPPLEDAAPGSGTLHRTPSPALNIAKS
jgi:lipopolysaccharide/colanic/teichoic acid biosynthesis glycosyltransferase